MFQDIVDYLASVGHVTHEEMLRPISISQGIARDPDSGRLYAAADYRKSGGVDGIDNVETTTVMPEPNRGHFMQSGKVLLMLAFVNGVLTL